MCIISIMFNFITYVYIYIYIYKYIGMFTYRNLLFFFRMMLKN